MAVDERALRLNAVEFIHANGAASWTSLVEHVSKKNPSATQAHFDQLAEEFGYFGTIDETYISMLPHNPLGLSLRMMREFGIEAEEDLEGGLRRALGSGASVRSVGREVAASQAIALLSPIVSAWPPAGANDLPQDRSLVKRLWAAPGGVMARGDLAKELESNDDAPFTTWTLSYSPLVEMVANSIFGVRGAPIDIASIEKLRSRQNVGSWSSWGRLDRRRVWTEAKTRGEEIRMRLPLDVCDLLSGASWTLLGSTGSNLGELTVDAAGGVSVRWDRPAPAGWEAAACPALLEFDATFRSVYLFSGGTVRGDQDPRFVDGCCLDHGRWGFVFCVNSAIAAEGAVSVPLAVEGIGVTRPGEEAVFSCGRDAVTVKREPHAYRLTGLGAAIGSIEVGAFIRMAFRDGRCEIKKAVNREGDLGSLLLSAGVFTVTDHPWRSIGSALGRGVTERRDVRRAFANRQRFDLAHLTDSVQPKQSQSQSASISTADFEIVDGHLCQRIGRAVWKANPTSGTGVFGLNWSREIEINGAGPGWAIELLRWIKVWGAAYEVDQIDLRRLQQGWTSSTGLHDESLSQVFDELAKVPGRLETRYVTGMSTMVPLTKLGFLRTLNSASRRLSQLVITRSEWTGIDSQGREYGPAPQDALMTDDENFQNQVKG